MPSIQSKVKCERPYLQTLDRPRARFCYAHKRAVDLGGSLGKIVPKTRSSSTKITTPSMGVRHRQRQARGGCQHEDGETNEIGASDPGVSSGEVLLDIPQPCSIEERSGAKLQGGKCRSRLGTLRR